MRITHSPKNINMERQIIKTDGTTINYSPKAGAHYELEELQEIVGGFIEIISLHDGRMMVINEEGKLNGLPYNDLATDIAHDANAIYDDDFVVGDILICKEGDIL